LSLRNDNKGAAGRSQYFAYGSNLNKRQMSERCPTAVPLLLGWRLVFRRTTDIVPCFGYTVLGGLYSVANADIQALDRYEGVPHGRYRRRYFRVRGERVLTYVMNNGIPMRHPPPEYYQLIEQGYRDWKLPMHRLIGSLLPTNPRRHDTLKPSFEGFDKAQ
jgi:gamma-glutamylcyclotransferase (GGCT)/AIG2-like uncharacterized protein YtfP